MSGKQIGIIYFYIVSVIGLTLMIVGVFHSVNFFLNSTQFEQYPLRYSAATCDYPYDYPKGAGPYPAIAPDMQQSTPSAAEIQRQQTNCKAQQELDRKQHKVDDMKNAFTFSFVGLVLFLIHFPQARKQSKN